MDNFIVGFWEVINSETLGQMFALFFIIGLQIVLYIIAVNYFGEKGE